MSVLYEVGKKATYKNPITGMVADCVVSKDVPNSANVIPVNILNSNGEVLYGNAWVSKENLQFED